MKKEKTKRAVWTWEATGALFCFTAGIGAALLGSLLTASTWILGAALHPWMHGLGTALLIVTIPLLIFAGYCMDWAERDQNKSATQKSRNGGPESLRN
jgi:membrane protein DedA with SNARE-associated domain